MELEELGRSIRQARLASGISQAQLARIAGVSRATVNYAETGRTSLGAAALLRVLTPLGLGLAPTSWRGQESTSAVSLLAATASVSYAETLPVATLEHALLTGDIDELWLAHLALVVDESSDSMLLRAVREVSEKHDQPAVRIWRNIVRIATSVASPNPRWA